LIGLIMSVGPLVSVFCGVLAGGVVDRFGSSASLIAGLIEMAAGAFALSVLPAMFGTAGYVAAIIVLTPGYQLFQSANNTAVMMDVASDQRGVMSAILNLSRNLGLITGASAMGAIFALASGTSDFATASPAAVATGMRITFAIAAVLIVVATLVARGRGSLATPPSLAGDGPDAS
jgi:MFS family permease